MSHDVITIGAATIDAFVWSKSFQTLKSSEFSTGIGECFSLGSKIDISRLEIATGGGATNAAATFANLGFHTGIATRVGKDMFGRTVREDLADRGITIDHVVRDPKQHTGFSTILVVPSGERTVLTFRGASEHFVLENVPKTPAKWYYVTNLAGRFDVLKKIITLRQAQGDKTKIFWNPGSADLRLGLERLRPILRAVDVLDLNREEAAALTGLLPDQLKEMIKKIATFFRGILIITDGDRGAHAHDGTRLHFVAPRDVKAINRTGAGDAFGSGFLAGWMKTNDLVRGLQLAALNAESVIQKIGAKAGLLTKWPAEKTLNEIVIKII